MRIPWCRTATRTPPRSTFRAGCPDSDHLAARVRDGRNTNGCPAHSTPASGGPRRGARLAYLSDSRKTRLHVRDAKTTAACSQNGCCLSFPGVRRTRALQRFKSAADEPGSGLLSQRDAGLRRSAPDYDVLWNDLHGRGPRQSSGAESTTPAPAELKLGLDVGTGSGATRCMCHAAAPATAKPMTQSPIANLKAAGRGNQLRIRNRSWSSSVLLHSVRNAATAWPRGSTGLLRRDHCRRSSRRGPRTRGSTPSTRRRPTR